MGRGDREVIAPFVFLGRHGSTQPWARGGLAATEPRRTGSTWHRDRFIQPLAVL